MFRCFWTPTHPRYFIFVEYVCGRFCQQAHSTSANQERTHRAVCIAVQVTRGGIIQRLLDTASRGNSCTHETVAKLWKLNATKNKRFCSETREWRLGHATLSADWSLYRPGALGQCLHNSGHIPQVHSEAEYWKRIRIIGPRYQNALRRPINTNDFGNEFFLDVHPLHMTMRLDQNLKNNPCLEPTQMKYVHLNLHSLDAIQLDSSTNEALKPGGPMMVGKYANVH
ncbi:hypothetical protein T265_00796 [Opisthorchis viverrini]|uniref:Uncharacterized protein n=1 Tax=Opisthorchis viverrini TaxID=6198 RepID=A0A075ABS4_OPIVI|nr:hypothetical protein T265_00796 [Opisthorchis viverrini]KER33295.1 hypothetical protein T265_00796 [Opisthorchis viverrini]